MSDLFPKGASSDQIVKMVLTVLQAQYQNQADRLREILSRIDEAEIAKWIALWEELEERHDSPGEALAVLTKIIAADIRSAEGVEPSLAGNASSDYF
jgi:hypothetical protein